MSPGTLRAVSYANNQQVTTNTAGEPAQIKLSANRTRITVNGRDPAFVKVEVLDVNGNLVPKADKLGRFEIAVPGAVVTVDNGNPISYEPFKAMQRKAFNGLAQAIVQSPKQVGTITLTANGEELKSASVKIQSTPPADCDSP